MNTAAPAGLGLLIPAGLVAFMLLRRFQRFTTAQPLDARGRRRLMIRPIILAALALLVLFAPHSALGYVAALLGAVVGAGLAYWSAHNTRYEYGPDGQATRYVPNVWIGGGVFVLFLLRLISKLWPLLTGHSQMTTAASGGFDPAQFAGASPLTTALFWVFVAYQIAYALLVLRAARPHQVALK